MTERCYVCKTAVSEDATMVYHSGHATGDDYVCDACFETERFVFCEECQEFYDAEYGECAQCEYNA